MNRKAIKSVLKKKLNDWIESVDNAAIKKEISENVIITGGAISSMLQNEEPKDFDVYFTSKEAAKNVAEYYIEKFNSTHDKHAYLIDGATHGDLDKCKDLPSIDGLPSIIKTLGEDRIRIVFEGGGVSGDEEIDVDKPFEDVFDQVAELDETPDCLLDAKEKYRPIFMSPNAITLSDKIQIVIRFHGKPDEIHETYDYVHCMNYWESNGGNLFLNQEALESILSKHLIYRGSKYPLCSVIRMRKFIKRGWHINAGQILKMLFQVSELDLTDIDVLEDQLIGVDTAYFTSLICSLRKRMEEESFTLTTEYISTIIDKIF